MTRECKPTIFLWVIIQEFELHKNPIAFDPFTADEVDEILREKEYTVNKRGFFIKRK